MAAIYQWRGAVANTELNELHAEAFDTPVVSDAEWNWADLLAKHSLGWVVAREDDTLIGFVNVIWDGMVHAWLQDTMVARSARNQGIGKALVLSARDRAHDAGCQWLHVDYEDHLSHFYEEVCGFTPTNAGLMSLSD